MENKELELVLKTLDDHKCEDIKQFEVGDMTPFASYYVICSCLNIRQLEAVADILAETLEKNGFDNIKMEGTAESGWIIVQADEVITHLFISVNRKEIDLEDLISKITFSHKA